MLIEMQWPACPSSELQCFMKLKFHIKKIKKKFSMKKLKFLQHRSNLHGINSRARY